MPTSPKLPRHDGGSEGDGAEDIAGREGHGTVGGFAKPSGPRACWCGAWRGEATLQRPAGAAADVHGAVKPAGRKSAGNARLTASTASRGRLRRCPARRSGTVGDERRAVQSAPVGGYE
jgi:hypothetical protein